MRTQTYDRNIWRQAQRGLAVALLAGLIPLAAAMADKADISEALEKARDPMVNIMLGKAEVVDVGGAVSDILVANPSIVDVMAVKSNRLYLVGARLGDTNIIVLDEAGDILKRLNVHVQLDTDKMETVVRELYPNEDVKIQALTDQLILTGNVSTPAVANSIANLVAQSAAEMQDMDAGSVDEVITNMLDVRGEQQIMLRVKIIEVARSALKDLGVETNFNGGRGGTPNIGALGTALATSPALGLTSPAQLGILSLSSIFDNFGPVNWTLRALEEEGIVNTLAEPNLTAISGEQAGFLAGGEFPIPTEIDRNGNLVYEFRPFGVSLNFRPVVLSENRISMEMMTEVSTATFSQNLQLNGINVPTFNVRRAQTTVELPSGGTLMIAGLLQSESISGLTQLPGVGDLPVVGDLIKSDTFNRDESELVVMVTPFLVQPFAQDQSGGAGQPSTDHAQAPMMPAAPQRDDNKLTQVFGNNIRRTYGSSAPESLLSEVGAYGYITD